MSAISHGEEERERKKERKKEGRKERKKERERERNRERETERKKSNKKDPSRSIYSSFFLVCVCVSVCQSVYLSNLISSCVIRSHLIWHVLSHPIVSIRIRSYPIHWLFIHPWIWDVKAVNCCSLAKATSILRILGTSRHKTGTKLAPSDASEFQWTRSGVHAQLPAWWRGT